MLILAIMKRAFPAKTRHPTRYERNENSGSYDPQLPK